MIISIVLKIRLFSRAFLRKKFDFFFQNVTTRTSCLSSALKIWVYESSSPSLSWTWTMWNLKVATINDHRFLGTTTFARTVASLTWDPILLNDTRSTSVASQRALVAVFATTGVSVRIIWGTTWTIAWRGDLADFVRNDDEGSRTVEFEDVVG